MKHFFRMTSGLLAMLLIFSLSVSAQQITSAGVKGNWSSGATWTGGVVPGPTNTVLSAADDTVRLDANTVVAGLTVGEATGKTRLQFTSANAVTLIVNGNILITANAKFNVVSSAAGGELADTIIVTGDFTNEGVLDFSSGSAGSTKANARLIFAGTSNSTFSSGPYDLSKNNEFAGVTIRKTGGARIILNSDLVNAGGSNSSAANVNPFIFFESGFVEALNGALISVWTASNSFQGYSPDSYVIGAVGRGINNGGGSTTKEFPVGDANGLRPVTLHFNAPGNSTGHYVQVTALAGDASTISTTYGAGIDKVSGVRYYAVRYREVGTTAAYDSMDVDFYSLKYMSTDGVAAGNQDLRVAVTDTNATSWKNAGPLVALHTTRLDTMAYIKSDSVLNRLGVWGSPFYIALSRATGTTDNSLVGTGTFVTSESDVPNEFVLGQNYPNPFNPSTKITYGVPANGHVSLAIFNLLGQRVATLFEGMKAAGTHTAVWNGVDESGRNVPSGVYIYRMEGGGVSQAKRMVLMK